MHCAGCASRLERAAQAVPGVAAARANFALHQVALELETAEALGQALAAVEKAGFRPANPPVVTLTIEGITCASCVTRIESLLAKVPGVVAASVNPALGQAQVRGWADPAALLAAVRKGGYTARVLDATARLAAVPSETTAKTAQKAALIAAAFTLPLVVLEMGGHLSPALHAFLHHSVGTLGLAFLQWALASVVLAWPGAGFARVGWPALFRGAPDMNSLVALGTGAAWAWSSAVTLSMAFGHPLSDALYFEPAAVIITLVLVGRWLEARAKGQALASIHGLLELAPKHARRQTASGGWEEVSVDVIALGDILAVPPGTRVPVDGVVIEGEGAVDESLLTGEPIPVVKEKGAPVHAGTLNTEGALIMRATAVGAETMLQQIARLAAQAQAAKLPIQALVDRVARWFVPVVIVVAVLSLGAWLLAGAPIDQALASAMAVLIVACPCALGLATPVAVVVATGRAAGMGILVRDGAALQRLADARAIAFDKTGTLTEGRPRVTTLEPLPGVRPERLLTLAAAAEARSEHPLARAILAEAGARGLAVPPVEAFVAKPGLGVQAIVEGRALVLGTAAWLAEHGVDPQPLSRLAERLAEGGSTPVLVAFDGQAVGVIGLADALRPDAEQAIAALKAAGLSVALFSGDAAANVDRLARALGIAEAKGGLSPAGKLAALATLPRPVAFVGDGINDAPALSAADVGIALGTGTEIAIESADLILPGGRLSAVAEAIGLARATVTNIKQNLVWAFAYNAALIPIAAGVFYPLGGPTLRPELAAFAMVASSLSVLGNALRLRRYGLRQGKAHGARTERPLTLGPVPRASH